jgi:general secretion pathway protein F
VPPLLLAAVPAIWFRLTRNEGWRLSFDGWRLRLPWIGGLVLRAETARLARTLAVLLRSGVHLLDAVAISARVIENRALRASLAGLTQDLRQGEGLSKALRRNRLMPTLLVRMLEVGEETGSLDRMLERAAEIHENELRTSVRRGLSLLEPVLICLLGLMVGAIVLAMFLAISDMQNRV